MIAMCSKYKDGKLDGIGEEKNCVEWERKELMETGTRWMRMINWIGKEMIFLTGPEQNWID
jgi:hypothetical protein